MGYLWRRRSSLLKIACLLSAVWFTVAFLIYTDDRGSAGSGSGSGSAADASSLQDAHNLPLKAAPFDFNNANDIEDDNFVGGAAAGNDAIAAAQQQQHHQLLSGAGVRPPAHPRQRDRLAPVAEAPVPAAPAEAVDVIAGKLQTGAGKTVKRPEEGKSAAY